MLLCPIGVNSGINSGWVVFAVAFCLTSNFVAPPSLNLVVELDSMTIKLLHNVCFIVVFSHLAAAKTLNEINNNIQNKAISESVEIYGRLPNERKKFNSEKKRRSRVLCLNLAKSIQRIRNSVKMRVSQSNTELSADKNEKNKKARVAWMWVLLNSKKKFSSSLNYRPTCEWSGNGEHTRTRSQKDNP